MKWPPYLHRAHYYETDQMAIVHHSNYIRWFEEGRVYFMELAGYGFKTMEAEGIISPVLSVTCNFKSMVRFDDQVMVLPKLESFSGAKLTMSYRIIDCETQQLRADGQSSHGFLDRSGRPVSLKKANPKMYELFAALVGQELWDIPAQTAHPL